MNFIDCSGSATTKCVNTITSTPLTYIKCINDCTNTLSTITSKKIGAVSPYDYSLYTYVDC